MLEYLTDDLTINILSRLSMKALLRCRSVCKLWKSAVASPFLFKAHIDFSKNYTPQLLIRRWRKRTKLDEYDSFQESYLSYYGGKTETVTFDLYNKFNLPFIAYNGGVYGIGGSVNGLICFCNFGMPVFIWNPLLNKVVCIPKIKPVDYNDQVCIAFGFDIIRNDYKIIRITGGGEEVELFRLSTRTWENIMHLYNRDVQNLEKYYTFGDPANIHGAAHWIAKNLVKGLCKILKFDMQSEVFQFMKFPSILRKFIKYPNPKSQIFAGQGSICLIHRFRRVGNESEFHIWLMKEYGNAKSWIIQFSVDVNYKYIPQGFLNNGEMLWWTGDTLISYDNESKRFRVIGGRPSTSESEKYDYEFVDRYEPSFELHDQKVDWDSDRDS